MKTLAIPALAALVLGGTASAAVPTEVNMCMEATNAYMHRAPIYETFIPTQFLDTATVINGEQPYGDGDPTMISTLVMIEGLARKTGKPDDKTEVTVKCGITGGDVKVINILPGHNLPVTRPS